MQEAAALDKDNSSGQKTEEPKITAKKVYKTPSFEYEKIFEVGALACGKVQSTERNCRLSRKTS
jgi:hypothetical protein